MAMLLDRPRITRAGRERTAAARLGITWLSALGWIDGPLLMVSAGDHRNAEHVRKELRRVEVMVGMSGAERFGAWCVEGAPACAALRRQLASTLTPWRVSGDLYGVDSEAFAFQVSAAVAALGTPLLSDAGRLAAIEREMERMR